jgi:hypothetical protein
MIILEENFRWHLEAFASELFIYKCTEYINKKCIYLKVGGFDGASRLRSAEAYNPLTNIWRDVASMYNPRSNFGIEVRCGQLISVSGETMK